MPKTEEWKFDSQVEGYDVRAMQRLRRREWFKVAVAATALGALVFPSVEPGNPAAKAEVRIAEEVTGTVGDVVGPVLEPVIDFLAPPVEVPQQDDAPINIPQNIPSLPLGGRLDQNQNQA